MPGYCVQGTVGTQVLGGAKKIEIENRQTVEVKLSVEELGIDCFMPANGETAVIKTALPVRAVIDQGLLMKSKQKYEMNPPDPKRPCLVHGVLVVKDDLNNNWEEPFSMESMQYKNWTYSERRSGNIIIWVLLS
ncbi:integrator complex subunit 11-like isoform X4 [Artemia franciscana]|uniref:integrator complex subunit 11-like isoform X4 n=1 Tax=Artemia franciscana TaxID=6661 RepID=UPI0032DA8179